MSTASEFILSFFQYFIRVLLLFHYIFLLWFCKFSEKIEDFVEDKDPIIAYPISLFTYAYFKANVHEKISKFQEMYIGCYIARFTLRRESQNEKKNKKK